MSLKQRYDAVLALVQDGVLVVDHGGRVLEANDAAATALGTTADALVGRRLETAGLVGHASLRQVEGGTVVVLRRVGTRPVPERRRREQQYVDPATGIDNAAGFERAVAVACAVAAPGAASGLVVVDATGVSATPTELVARLTGSARADDVLARLEDRRFAIVVRDLPDLRDVEILAERLRAALPAGTAVSSAAVDRPVAPAVLERLAYEASPAVSGS